VVENNLQVADLTQQENRENTMIRQRFPEHSKAEVSPGGRDSVEPVSPMPGR